MCRRVGCLSSNAQARKTYGQSLRRIAEWIQRSRQCPLSARLECTAPLKACSILQSCRCSLSAPEEADGWALPLEVPAGSAVVMDARTVHAGGGHSSPAEPGGPSTDRAVLYFSWAELPGSSRWWLPRASTYALHPSNWGSRVPLRRGQWEDGGGWTPLDLLMTRMREVAFKLVDPLHEEHGSLP